MSSGIGNLTTLIKRLEAATSRLEDIAMAQSATTSDGSAASSSTVAGTATAVTANAPALSSEETATQRSELDAKDAVVSDDVPVVRAWDNEVMSVYQKLAEKTHALGPVMGKQVDLVGKALDEVRTLIVAASHCRKPEQGLNTAVVAEYLQPLQTALKSVIEFREAHRGEKTFFNHLSTLSEGISSLGWVAVEPTPGPYISEMKDSAQFYANRVIKDFKGVSETHVDWVRSFMALLDTMKSYVMTHYRTGLSWNPQGQNLSTYMNATSSRSESSPAVPPGSAPPAPAPPAPPAPPAAGMLDSSSSAVPGGGMDAVFSEINQGEGITRSLRKVDKSEMTHKNPGLRENGAACIDDKTRPKPGVKPASLSTKKRGPPRKVLEGNKWTVENFENDSHVVIDGTDLGHTVNIFNCDNSVIEVKGKVNAVSLLSCVKTSVLLDTLVSSLEVTRCTSFAAQVTGYTPTVLIDNTDGGQMYLSEQGLKTDIITAKSSALNVCVPAMSGEPGVIEEIALPEQLKHTLTRSGTRTQARSEVVQHAG